MIIWKMIITEYEKRNSKIWRGRWIDELVIPIDCQNKVLQPTWQGAMTRVIQIKEYLRVLQHANLKQ